MLTSFLVRPGLKVEDIMVSIDNPSDATGRLIAAGELNGTSVFSTSGDELGSVYGVMLDKASGK